MGFLFLLKKTEKANKASPAGDYARRGTSAVTDGQQRRGEERTPCSSGRTPRTQTERLRPSTPHPPRLPIQGGPVFGRGSLPPLPSALRRRLERRVPIPNRLRGRNPARGPVW